MDGDIADIFWDISFKPKAASELNYLVPSYSRSSDDGRVGRLLASPDSEDSSNDSFSRSFVVSRNVNQSSLDTTVTILECRDDGVMSRLSTELWEAALLLSAYLIRHKDMLTSIPDARVLELGCGCGLVGLVALDVLACSEQPSDSAPYLCFSDYDSITLDLLVEGLTSSQKHLTRIRG
jgi:Lysine methyltransferase